MSRQAHLGFTLIELMMGLAIAAILLVLAVPNYTIWIADNQIRSGAESIAGGLRFAEGAGNVIMTVVPAATTIATFSSLGVIQTNADGSGTLTQVKVTSPLAGSRNLNVLVGVAAGATGAGRIKVCDPKWPANDPKGCPP